MAELVDAADLKSVGSNPVPVRFRPSAPIKTPPLAGGFLIGMINRIIEPAPYKFFNWDSYVFSGKNHINPILNFALYIPIRRTTMKMRTVMIILIAILYGIVMYFVLNPDAYGAYLDYYLFHNRVFSRHDEKAFERHTLPGSIELYKTYRVGKNDPHITYLGFSTNQTSGRWTHGKYAKMAFELPKITTDVIVRFHLNPYVNTHNQRVDVEVFVNGVNLDIWNFRERRSFPRTEFVIPKNMLKDTHRVNIDFKIKGYDSPKQLGYGNNNNKLGFFLKEFEVVPKPTSR